MEQGQYRRPPRRRRRRINWTGVIFWLVVLAIVITVIALLFKPADKPADLPDNNPTDYYVDILPIQAILFLPNSMQKAGDNSIFSLRGTL